MTEQEKDRLLVAAAAALARRRLARGARLGATEATALIVDEIHEAAWDGRPLDEVHRIACSTLGPEDVLPGVPAMIQTVQVDALFPAGTFLVSVSDPVSDGPPSTMDTQSARRLINVGCARRQLTARNVSDQVIRVTSHVEFARVDSALEHDRELSRGWRLDIPAGSSLAWAPEESRTVDLVPDSAHY